VTRAVSTCYLEAVTDRPAYPTARQGRDAYERQTGPAAVVYPFLLLDKTYELQTGVLGPADQVIAHLPEESVLRRLIPRIEVRAGGDQLVTPAIAITNGKIDDLLRGLEVFKYLYELEDVVNAQACEVLDAPDVLVTTNEGKSIRVNDYMWLNEDGWIGHKADYLPMIAWNSEEISKMQAGVDRCFSSPMMNALRICLLDESDKEIHRTREQIIVATILYNQAFVHHQHSLENVRIVLMSAAFEALLNLSEREIKTSFSNSVAMLLGENTALLRQWCGQFYDVRSGLVHGGDKWTMKSHIFRTKSGVEGTHIWIARNVFHRCLEAKLFLMGLLDKFDNHKNSFARMIVRYRRTAAYGSSIDDSGNRDGAEPA
jgi:hypothetical protein